MTELANALDKVSRPPILTLLAGCVVLVTALMLGNHVLHLDAQRPGGVAEMGDFLAFYTGAELIASGQGADLYDLGVQRALQDRFDPGDQEVWLPYVNPPLLGAVLAPFAGLGIEGCMWVFDALCVLAFAAAAWALSRQLPQLTRTRARAVATLVTVLAFLPVPETMLRGQNSVLTLSLLTLCYAAHRAGRLALLGLALGLLSFKPQFGLLLGVLLILRQEWVAVAVALVVSAGHYLLGAAIAGFGWPLPMLDAIATIEPGQPLHTEICLRGALNYTLGGGTVVQGVGGLLALAVAVHAGWHMVRTDRDDPAFPVVWALLAVATVVSCPHVQAYDAAILVLPAVLLVDARLRDAPSVPLGERALPLVGFLALPFVTDARALGFQPQVFGVAAMYAWAVLAVHRHVGRAHGADHR